MVAGIVYGAFALRAMLTARNQEAAQAASTPTVFPQATTCAAGTLSVSLSAPSEVSVGEGVTATATIHHAEGAPCLIDAGGGALALAVQSGNDKIWDSASCQDLPESKPLLLGPNDEATLTLRWDGRRGSTSCLAAAPSAAPSAASAATPASSAAPTGQENAADPAATNAAVADTQAGTQASGAGAGEVAAAGTYILTLTIDGTPAAGNAVVTVK